MKLKDISIVLMSFGAAIILASFLDFSTLLYPVLIKNPEWIFAVSQNTAGFIVFPVFGILAFMLGLIFSNFRRNQKIMNITKFVFGSICALFFIFISLNILMYGISMNAVKTNKIEALKTENNRIKEQINANYKQNKELITLEKYNFAIKRLDNNLIYKINYLNLTYTKINIKTLMTLFFFSFVYLIAAVKFFSLDKLLLKKRKLLENEKFMQKI